MSILESPEATWDKRFKQSHYSYRDFYSAATGADPTATTATYFFGAASRAVNVRNWPAGVGSSFIATGDYTDARHCFARSVMVQCTQDAWIILTSLNPRWLKRYNQYRYQELSHTVAVARLVTDGISQTILEITTFIPKGSMITLNPTYGIAVTFWYVSETGTIRFWIEGNTEGRE